MKILGTILLVTASHLASAQNLRTLTRSTSTTGANDSALTLVNDSASRTRAASLAQIRKALSVKAFDSLITTKLTLTGATITGAPAWSSVQTFATGQKVDSASALTATAIGTLARATAITGLNDSALVVVRDSASRTRAASTHELFKRPAGGASNPSFTFALDSTTGIYRSAASTLAFAAGGSLVGTVNNLAVWNNSAAKITFGNGSASLPTFSFSSDPNTGIYNAGVDSIGFATNGIASLAISGGSTPRLSGLSGNWDLAHTTVGGKFRITATGVQSLDTLVLGAGVMRGGAGNTTIQSGTGANRTLVFQTTNGGSTVVTALTLDQTQQAVFGGTIFSIAGSVTTPGVNFVGSGTAGMYRAANDTLGLSSGSSAFLKGLRDTLIVPSKAKAIALTAASGTPNAVCIDATTHQLLENAALTCTVSSARYKKNILPLTNAEADHIVFGLKPKSFTYRDGGRRSIHVIAEQADSVDKRIPTYDAQGRPNSVDDAVIVTALLQVVQRQQKTLDSLITILRKR